MSEAASFEKNITNSTNETIRTTATDDRTAGACFLLTAIWGLLGYGMVLPAIASSKKLRHPCYAIIFSMGVSDSISLLAWIVIGVYTTSRAQLLPYSLIKHSLCILVVGWGSLTIHIGVLGINRYMAICLTEKHDRMFSGCRMYLILASCWVYAIFVHAFPTFLPPNMDYTLDGYLAYWDNPKISDYYFVEDISWCSTIFLLNFFCYTAIILRYRKVRAQFSTLRSSIAASRRRQFRLALQCMIRCCTFFIYDVVYYVIGYVTENIWLTYIFSMYLWAFNNALSPWLYLSFDQQLRTVIKNWFLDKKNAAVTEHPGVTAIASFTSAALGNRVRPGGLTPVESVMAVGQTASNRRVSWKQSEDVVIQC